MLLLQGAKGVAKDPVAARAQFERAAAKNHSGALYNLGIMELNGVDGKTPDYAKSAQYFLRAANAGDDNAAYSYGVMLREGKGVPQDIVEAAHWLKRAADGGIHRRGPRAPRSPGRSTVCRLFRGLGRHVSPGKPVLSAGFPQSRRAGANAPGTPPAGHPRGPGTDAPSAPTDESDAPNPLRGRSHGPAAAGCSNNDWLASSGAIARKCGSDR